MIRFIDKYRDRYGVEFLCRTLRAAVRGFLTSRGYRAAKARTPSVRQLRDELLIPEIQRLHKKNYSGGLSVKRWIWDWPDRKEGQ